MQYGHGRDHVAMLDASQPIHEAYCRRWGADLIVKRASGFTPRTPHWRKVELMIEALTVGAYDQVLWLDSDVLITDPSVDVFSASGYGIACCECHDSPTTPRHYNTGVIWVTASPETMAFLAAWNAGRGGEFWEDQARFISLVQARRWRDLLSIVSNRFNMVERHMQATNPIIRAWHGDPDRVRKLEAAVRDLQRGRGAEKGRLAPPLLMPAAPREASPRPAGPLHAQPRLARPA